MRKMANDIQAVINTLSGVSIVASPENIEKFFGVFQVLARTRDDLKKIADIQEQMIVNNNSAASSPEAAPVVEMKEAPIDAAADPE